jgi:glycosyltransferase involved in cell wall biosynthesis
MTVSVIIPNYNHAPYLVQRIESVLNQTFQDFELIILDDCSTDKSRNIIEQYREHPKVSKIVYNETNSGSAFKQWQKGIELAEGEWIWIAESDDWCENNLLENLICPVLSEKDIVLSFCGSVVFRENRILYYSKGVYFNGIIDGKSFVSDRMMHANSIINASMAIFSKKVIEKLDPKYTILKFCGDWLFWIYIAEQGKVYESGKMLNYFRKHEKDVTGSAILNGLYHSEYLIIAKELKNKHYLSPKIYVRSLINWMSGLKNDHRVNNIIKREIEKLYLSEIGYYNYFTLSLKKVIKNILRYQC